MKKTGRRTALVLAVLFMMVQATVSAEELSATYHVAKDGTLYTYVENPGEYESVACQIGLEESPDVTVKELTDPELSVSTYLIIDNSLSIQEQYRDTMKQVAKDLIFSGKGNESFTIATFDTELHCLVEDSQDSKKLIETVEQIEFVNQSTQVINTLYQLYDQFDKDEENNLKRIILMTDGGDTKAIGYTREELMEKVEAFGYPFYTLGCTYESSETELENLFRISRETGAEYYHLDEGQSADQIAAGIADSFDLVQVRAEIPEGQRDGSEKGIQISFLSGGQEKTVSFTQIMPFLAKGAGEPVTEQATEAATDAPETESATERVTEAATEPETEAPTEAATEPETEAPTEAATEPETEAPTEAATEPETEALTEAATVAEAAAPETESQPSSEEATEIQTEGTGGSGMDTWMVILLACVVFVVVVALLLLLRKRGGQKDKEKKDVQGDKEEEDSQKTEGDTELVEDDLTEDLNGKGRAGGMVIRLTDTKKTSVMVEYSLGSTAIVGRSPQKSQIVFDYEKSVSGQHCELSRSGDKVFIRDLDSANGTFVNGSPVKEKQELESGSVIKMGRLLVQFQILKTGKGQDEKKGLDDTRDVFA